MDHRTQASPSGQSNLKLQYSYDRRNLPTQILESSETGLVAPTTTTYTYDDRGRLIAESRSTPDTQGISYDLEYDYDAGGNRTEKRDFINNQRVVYTYDFTDPVLYSSANNRLMLYKTQQLDGTLLSTTYYFYNEIGNPTSIVTKKEFPGAGEPRFSATRLGYGTNEQVVMFMLGETWDTDPVTQCTFNYSITFARQFGYGTARQRHMVRELSPSALENGSLVTVSETWSDYDGNDNYGDYTVANGVVTQSRQYAPGIGTIDGPSGTSVATYLHGDQLGTLRTATSATGSTDQLRVFTAFGEPMTNTPQSSDRYGYIGTLGYQTPTSDTANDPYAASQYLHVGARYYDSASGRFLQRDPIGISGGLNVYTYAGNTPTIAVDPSGEVWFTIIIGAVIGTGVGIVTAIISGADATGIAISAVGGGINGALIGAGLPPAAAGAIAGAFSGGAGAYGQGQGTRGILLSAGVGGGLGALGSGLGGLVPGSGIGTSITTGVAFTGFGLYYFDLPASICGAAGRLNPIRSLGGPPFSPAG